MSAEGLCGGLAAIMLITGCSPLPAVTPGREGDSGTARSYRLDTVIEVEGRQGVAADGNRYFVSGPTELYVYTMTDR